MYLSFASIFAEHVSELLWVESQRSNFFTFDDGPIPEVSPGCLINWINLMPRLVFVLVRISRDFLNFFDVGLNKGSYYWNHTYNHLSGWCTDNAAYFENVRKGALVSGSNLFRPPYGRLKPSANQIFKAPLSNCNVGCFEWGF